MQAEVSFSFFQFPNHRKGHIKNQAYFTCTVRNSLKNLTMTTSPLLTVTLIFLITLLGICSATNPESAKWLAENSKKEGVITLPLGLQYKVLTKGSGDSHPTPNAPTECHYEGRLINGDVFDSSYDRGEPASFAADMVIKGWTEAMQIMVEGDKWELYIPSELGYGERGSPPKIGGGDALIFVMEMIEIVGDKVPAVKCNVVTLEECNDKEKTYVEKAKGKFESFSFSFSFSNVC